MLPGTAVTGLSGSLFNNDCNQSGTASDRLCRDGLFFYCRKGRMTMFDTLRNDMRVVRERDPAAKSWMEIFLCYPGLHAIWAYRIGHFFYRHEWFVLARLISHIARMLTGIEIHPGARIGKGLFIDHGMGIVIGETTVIGDNVTLYQGVTLGGTGKEKGKRHPTLKDYVVVACGAKVLGSFTIGEGAKIGAGSVVLKEVPPYATVVGIPGHVVAERGKRVHHHDESDVDLNHNKLPDPIEEQIGKLQHEVDALRKEILLLKTESKGNLGPV